jgi:dolichol-phosphate mannosyltransferase
MAHSSRFQRIKHAACDKRKSLQSRSVSLILKPRMQSEGTKSRRAPAQLSGISLGIVCPMANEEISAAAFVSEVLEKCRQEGFKSVTFFAILDRKSTDQTRNILDNLARRQTDLRVVWAPQNKCVVDAYLVGYHEALTAGCDWVLEIDAGFSHQPSDISQFFTRMREGYDCVFGSRFCRGGSIKESSLRRYLISRGGSIVSNALLGTSLKDMTGGFELFSRSTLQHVLDKGIRSRGPFFQTEIKAYCRRLKVVEVPIQYRGASHQVGSAALKDSFSNLWRLFQLRLQGEL